MPASEPNSLLRRYACELNPITSTILIPKPIKPYTDTPTSRTINQTIIAPICLLL